jgi:hypothetical protein
MTGMPPTVELQEALLELQQYLSDSVAPLIVADSIQLLLRYPPEAVASAIRAWTGAQYRSVSGRSVPVSDYLFHALKKIHMMGEFNLVPRQALEAYFEQLTPIVLGLCPEEDRETLKENLSRLGETPVTSSPVQTMFRQTSTAEGTRAASVPTEDFRTAAGEDAGTSAEALRNLRRFSLLLERLEAQGVLGGRSTSPANPIATEALAFAARSSHSGKELENYLGRLKSMGFEAGTDNLFRALAQSLPGWVVPASASAGAAGMAETGALGAMRRIITEAEDPVEGARRFQEMVKAVVERFNEGSLPQAVAMLELAERLVAEKKVDTGSAEIVRRRLGETLEAEQLRKFAEKPDQHELLRKVLRFFTSLTPEGLLEDLQREQKRDRRRLILLLLEVHGAPARAAAHEQLSRPLSTAVGEEEWFFRRNLLYVLRRIPRSAEASFEDEADVFLRHAQLGLPLVVLKEAIAALSQYKDEKTEEGLIQLLSGLEEMLGKPDEAPYEARDMRALLDRIAATIARFPSTRAREALIEHAGKKQLQLGDTMARLAELGGQNLSEDPETVDRLLGLLKANLPFKLLGVTLRQKEQNLVAVIDALAGTPSPSVRRALEEIVSRLRGQEAAKAASRVLAGFDRPPGSGEAAAPAEGPSASLQGDLDVFGLPALLQSLAASAASGTLTIREAKGGDVFATLVLREGKLQECRRGNLRGEEAFYQLFERPSPGQFAFVKGEPSKPPAALREILPLTFEAMRRYDEFQEAAALAPDSTLLEPSATKPTPHPAEKDGMFLQALWGRVSQGATPLDCEKAVASDSYRIRRILAHWVEQGALKPRAPAP